MPDLSRRSFVRAAAEAVIDCTGVVIMDGRFSSPTHRPPLFPSLFSNGVVDACKEEVSPVWKRRSTGRSWRRLAGSRKPLGGGIPARNVNAADGSAQWATSSLADTNGLLLLWRSRSAPALRLALTMMPLGAPPLRRLFAASSAREKVESMRVLLFPTMVVALTIVKSASASWRCISRSLERDEPLLRGWAVAAAAVPRVLPGGE